MFETLTVNNLLYYRQVKKYSRTKRSIDFKTVVCYYDYEMYNKLYYTSCPATVGYKSNIIIIKVMIRFIVIIMYKFRTM